MLYISHTFENTFISSCKICHVCRSTGFSTRNKIYRSRNFFDLPSSICPNFFFDLNTQPNAYANSIQNAGVGVGKGTNIDLDLDLGTCSRGFPWRGDFLADGDFNLRSRFGVRSPQLRTDHDLNSIPAESRHIHSLSDRLIGSRSVVIVEK